MAARLYRPPIVLIILAIVLLCVASPALYTVSILNWARSQGVYATPQEGVISRAYRWYCEVERVNIEQAATNSFDGSDPHIWYVMYTVHARSHAPCDSEKPGGPLYHQTYERGGSFYLNVKDGWVMMPEGFFPEFVGRWMKILGLAGPGDPTHVPRW